MKKIVVTLPLYIAFAFLFYSCAENDLPAAGKFNIDNYMGKWFEIAALPAGIEKGCTCTSFDYKLSKNRDYVMVINSCIKKGKQGAVLAKAFVDEDTPGSLWHMQFFWPFTKEHCILTVADDYSYAMAGRSDRKSLWIIGRNPVMDSVTYNALVYKAQVLGFDTSELIKTKRDCNPNNF